MRSAIVQLPEHRSLNEQRQVLRAAIRQLERADLYIAAVANMDTGEPDVLRAARAIRSDIESLRRRIIALRLSSG
jgi:hypothetical protein